VPPRRVPNAELRTREYLDEFEVERLMRAAKANRNGQRDATMILLAFRHGLRAAELVDLRWDQVDPDVRIRANFGHWRSEKRAGASTDAARAFTASITQTVKRFRPTCAIPRNRAQAEIVC
jgi:integrase